MNSHAILLVDDDAFHLNVLHAQLLELGYPSVILAQSGEEAIAHFERMGAQIDLIISDLAMPGMDGLVLMRHLAQRGFAASFILLSGTTDEILRSAASLAQAHHLNLLGVNRKPCTIAELRALLAQKIPHGVPLSAQRVNVALEPQRLAQALSAGEFIPWYQPKIDIRTGRCMSVEALARWPQACGGMISPSSFIPAMEVAALVDPLFFAMTERVLGDLAHWRTRGMRIKAALNMSMDTALNLSMPEQLLQRVLSHGLQPDHLLIEVTESKLMVERSASMETLTRLSLMGFALSIDDFGTGYSSLVQLVDLPFRELKIDGSFVRRASTERKAEAMVRISASIGETLGMDVVAEGVETAQQLDFLRTCGSTLVQGYFLARPMPFDSCTDWLQRNANSLSNEQLFTHIPRDLSP
jgi:EAL domain-containing protein (putative c-di-GMP-specific phosphodiesterase class I)/ActR/RegA family two-component response regulator